MQSFWRPESQRSLHPWAKCLPRYEGDRYGVQQQKRKKYAKKARQNEDADFSPFVLSVYGSFAPAANFLLKTIAEKASGGKDAREYGPNLFLLRARVQAAVLRGVANCIGGRTPHDGERARLRQAHRNDTHTHLIASDAGWR